MVVVVVVIHLEWCKGLDFEYNAKWYKHKPESLLEKETYGSLWEFELQMYLLIPAKRANIVLINKNKKRTRRLVNFAVPADQREIIKESQTINKNL